MRTAKYIKQRRVMTLATIDGQGIWCATVMYAVCGEKLIFHSSTDTRHGAAMVLNPCVAGAIVGRWRGIVRIKGLQFTGSVRRAEDAAARKAYLRLFPIARLMPLTLWELSIEEAKMTVGFEKIL